MYLTTSVFSKTDVVFLHILHFFISYYTTLVFLKVDVISTLIFIIDVKIDTLNNSNYNISS